MPKPLFGQHGHEYRFGPGLDRGAPLGGPHEVGAGAGFARDHVGMRHHRVAQARHGLRARIADTCAGAGKTRHGQPQPLQFVAKFGAEQPSMP